MSINTATIIGRITHDLEPKTIQTKNGEMSILDFNVAVDGLKNREDAMFIPVLAMGGTADNIAKYCGKGRQIGITGEISFTQYENKDGEKRKSFKIIARTVQFLASGKSAEQQANEMLESGERIF